MKPNQLATHLNVSPSTLRLWASKEFVDFLSPNASGTKGTYRSYDERDARILAWVAQLRAQNMAIEDIRAILKSAKVNNWRELPPMSRSMALDEQPVEVVPREAVEERLRAVQERHVQELQIIVKERDELKAQLAVARSETVAAQQDIKMLQERLTELATKEAELRGIASQYTLAGRRWNVAALISAALFAGVLLTVIIAILLTILHR